MYNSWDYIINHKIVPLIKYKIRYRFHCQMYFTKALKTATHNYIYINVFQIYDSDTTNHMLNTNVQSHRFVIMSHNL